MFGYAEQRLTETAPTAAACTGVSPDAVHFESVFRTTYVDLTRFAARRVELSVAEDVAADAFTVAWRRRADLPEDPGEARAWLFGITRNLILARQRHARRDQALTVRLERHDRAGSAVAGHEAGVIANADLEAAWTRLTGAQQETIALTVLDGLSSQQAAKTLGVSPVAYRLRLMRARRVLAAHLRVSTEPAHPTSHEQHIPPDTCHSEGR
jgi:RNA polymerase sigma-70 factor (ECF subfamily)